MEDYCIPTVIKLIPAKNSNPLNELLLRQCYNPKPLPTSSNLRADTDSLVDSLCEDFELLDAHPKPRTINVKMGSRTVKKLVFDDGFSFKDINIAVKKDFAMKYLISFVDHGNGVHEWGLLNSKSAGILITLIQKHVLFKEQYFYCPIGIKQSLVPVTSRENVHFSGYYQCLQKDCRHGFTVTISLRNIILNGSYVTVSLKSKNQCEHYNNFMAGFVRDCEAHLYGLTYAADEYNTLLANYNKSISIKYGNYAGVVVSNAQIRNIRRKNNAILSGNNVYSSIEEKFNAEINELTKKFKAKDMDQLGNVEGINYDDIGFIHDHVPAKCQLVLMHGAVTHILRKISKSSEHLILHMDDLSNVCKPTGRRLNHTVAYLPVKNKAPLQAFHLVSYDFRAVSLQTMVNSVKARYDMAQRTSVQIDLFVCDGYIPFYVIIIAVFNGLHYKVYFARLYRYFMGYRLQERPSTLLKRCNAHMLHNIHDKYYKSTEVYYFSRAIMLYAMSDITHKEWTQAISLFYFFSNHHNKAIQLSNGSIHMVDFEPMFNYDLDLFTELKKSVYNSSKKEHILGAHIGNNLEHYEAINDKYIREINQCLKEMESMQLSSNVISFYPFANCNKFRIKILPWRQELLIQDINVRLKYQPTTDGIVLELTENPFKYMWTVHLQWVGTYAYDLFREFPSTALTNNRGENGHMQLRAQIQKQYRNSKPTLPQLIDKVLYPSVTKEAFAYVSHSRIIRNKEDQKQLSAFMAEFKMGNYKALDPKEIIIHERMLRMRELYDKVIGTSLSIDTIYTSLKSYSANQNVLLFYKANGEPIQLTSAKGYITAMIGKRHWSQNQQKLDCVLKWLDKGILLCNQQIKQRNASNLTSVVSYFNT
eukprot:265623_1